MNTVLNQMFKIGTLGVAAVKNRVTSSQGPEHAPGEAVHQALRHFQDTTRPRQLPQSDVQRRSATELSGPHGEREPAKASLSTRKGRIKALSNQRIEPWMFISPRNKAVVLVATRRVLNEIKSGLLVERAPGGKQR